MSLKSKKTRETATPEPVAEHQPVSASVIPWSEWIDAELNAEKWDSPRNGVDGHFLDLETLALPPSLVQEACDWKRASTTNNLSSTPVVFVPENVSPDFMKNNKHLLHSEFIRWFISTVINLQYAGRNGLQIEGESANFSCLNGSRPWQGWMYVYSLSKAGKGAQHRPLLNPNGKYVVRLFFMGFWRRFVVDDMIPVDKNGVPLLPRTENDFELWPMLLAKAMMKIASLSWNNRQEIRDFYPVSCFTGWICVPLVTRSLSFTEKWDILTKHLNDVENPLVISSSSNIKSSLGQKNIETKNIPFILGTKSHPAVVVFANLVDTEDDVLNATPAWSHPVYIESFRDTSSTDPSQARWKKYRWLNWVTKNGMKKALIPAIRCLKVINPLKGYSEFVDEELYDEKTVQPSLRNEKQPAVPTGIPESLSPQAEQTLPDIGVLVDFEKMSTYLDAILMFYKASDFEYDYRVSDVLHTTVDKPIASADAVKGKSQAAIVKDDKKLGTSLGVRTVASFPRLLKWQHNASGCRSDPVYMLVDSKEAKFVLVNFSCMPQAQSENFSEFRASRSYLVIERYNFFKKSDNGMPDAVVRTYCEGASIFEPGPGRHLYRIFFREDTRYFIRILSDTIFDLGDRFQMYDLMSFESERIDVIARNINGRMIAALQEFGKANYPAELRTLYKCYMPLEADILRSKVHRKFVKRLHETFIKELTKLVKESFSFREVATICQALRVFFINPTIDRTEHDELPNFQSSDTYYEYEEDDVQRETRKSAAVKIQSFFRMILIRMYKKQHLPSHKKHSEIVQSLRKVAGLFDASNPQAAANFLIRKIVESISNKKQILYPCQEDFSLVLNVDELRGVVRNVQPNQWIPLLRIVLNAPTSGQKVFAGIDLLTNLPRYMLRVINNETCREVSRIGNTVATVHYPYVERGYTAFGYGWSDVEKIKELQWQVRVTTVKGEAKFQQISSLNSFTSSMKPSSLLVQELSNNYVPNVSNVIGKWIIRITANCLLSIRFSTSFIGVETMLEVIDMDENVMYVASGGSKIIMPAIFLSILEKPRDLEESTIQLLRYGERRKSDIARTRSRSKSLVLEHAKESEGPFTEYCIRAYAVNDSWPLTPTEWNVVNEVKTRGTVYDTRSVKTSASSVSKRGTKAKFTARGSQDILGDVDATSEDFLLSTLQCPSWRLQIVTDVGTKVQVEEDRRREMEIAAMKRSWDDTEAGRLYRGRTLREMFFEENSIVRTVRASTNSASQLSVVMQRGSNGILGDESSDLRVTSLLALVNQEIRTLEPPPNQSRVLLPFSVATYVAKDEEEEKHWVKTEDDEDMLRNHRAIHLLDFEHAQARHIDEDIEVLSNQRRLYLKLFARYLEKIEKWKNLEEDALERRKTYVAEVTATLLRRNSENAQGRNGKKKKTTK